MRRRDRTEEYLPLGWWHQINPLDPVNVNLNFWLQSTKLRRYPYQWLDAKYKAVFRKLEGLHDYGPEEEEAAA